jgi:hypothetical protein
MDDEEDIDKGALREMVPVERIILRVLLLLLIAAVEAIDVCAQAFGWISALLCPIVFAKLVAIKNLDNSFMFVFSSRMLRCYCSQVCLPRYYVYQA